MLAGMPQNPSLEDWVQCLKGGILLDSLDAPLGRALFLHLADLGVFEADTGDAWRLKDFEGSLDDVEALLAFLHKRLRELTCTDAGFALIYFMKDPPQRPEPEFLKTKETKSRPKKLFDKEPKTLPKESSDPSNLQIVKKIGKQLQSFVDLEKQFIERVQGPHTTRQDARRIFNAALEKFGNKAERRSWEQLSRRRHK
jgi:hypothetical protein